MTTRLPLAGPHMLDTNDLNNQVSTSFTIINQSGGVLLAGALTGGWFVTLVSQAVTPGSILMRSGGMMYNDDFTAYPGRQYMLRIANGGTSALTMLGAGSVTFNGQGVIQPLTYRDYAVTYSITIAKIPFMSIQAFGSGVYP